MQKLKAKLVKESYTAKQLYDKEQTSFYKVIAYSKGRFEEPICVRCWMGRSSTAQVVHASIWVHDKRKDKWYSGYGTAGGWGSHKESAAIGDAIKDAGIELYGDVYGSEDKPKHRANISGVGDRAVRYALDAITRACGFRKFVIVEG